MHDIADRPAFSEAEIRALFERHYTPSLATIISLPGERDQNFKITTSDGREYVFKISSESEDADFLDAQNQALSLVEPSCEFVPRLLRTRAGELKASAEIASGAVTPRRVLLRTVGYVRGQPMADVGYHSTMLLDDLGRKLGRLDRALEGFDHPALHREFDWNLVSGLQLVGRHATRIEDPALREVVLRFHEQLVERAPEWSSQLPRCAIHNDANDYNVIVSHDRDSWGERLVAAIIDFGDMAFSYRIAELAVASAYVVLRRPDSLSRACQVVRGYHSERPLGDAEVSALFDLMRLRLCVSACMAARQQALRPDDKYLSISQQPIRETLPRLIRMHPRLVESQFRAACGLPAVARALAVKNWTENQDTFPVMGVELSEGNAECIDLSVASPLMNGWLSGDNKTSDPVAPCQSAAKRPYLIGRYDEARLIYTDALFAAGSRITDPRRTVHLGIDVFTAAGTNIYAPLSGKVAYCHWQHANQNYGGIVLLAHQWSDGSCAAKPFFSLYGHLSRTSVDRLTVGDAVARGEVFAQLGTAAENGGWTPHLHFQLVVDDLELGVHFPGVVRASKAAAWKSLSPNPARLLGVTDILAEKVVPPRWDTQTQRRVRLGPNLRLAYRRPLKVVRGWMQYLFDETGRRYLDAYNNVPHVGHCHPHIVEAAHRQMATLNTNTRYLHDTIHQYAQRLADTLPRQLEVCYFVNSASEANELALRMARAATGRRAVIVQAGAYHGHTTTLIDISPYKHDGRGGSGTPPWVHKIPAPDSYRSEHLPSEPRCGKWLAERAMQSMNVAAFRDEPPGALIVETCPSVGGQLIPPDGYLRCLYDAARQIGALTIADEVQTGFGRMGTNFWAFADHGVTPDIVVMGKPMGNGHPIGAVVTTRNIAAAFDNGMEFFSTFGGNTVSCAVGMAVLDVLDGEQLQARALETGACLRRGFHNLLHRHELLGDVRGRGLFWGLELVVDRQSKQPAAAAAAAVTNRMREAGVLIGTEGPYNNVLKIRPPMPFHLDDAALMLELLDEILGSL